MCFGKLAKLSNFLCLGFSTFLQTSLKVSIFSQAVSGSQSFCKAFSMFLSVDKISVDLLQGYLKINLLAMMCLPNITRVINVNKQLN